MNKPAPKEPSMDEILSSIRQIIADDDAAAPPRRPSIQAAPAPMQASPVRAFPSPAVVDIEDQLEEPEPLALSSEQIVGQKPDDEPGGFSFDDLLAESQAEGQDDEQEDQDEEEQEEPPMMEPASMAFDPEPEEEIEEPVVTPMAPPPRAPEPEFLRTPEPVRAPEPAPQPRASVSQAAPLPDPTLSSDFAEELLGPATKAAVRSSITKLNTIGLGNAGLTIEALMRDMLRPMLREWLDENLPSVVERMVEREIARISRGD